ncbi:DNA-directed RNA polymerase 1B [Forsythia ovata]|uniref:DNA-directed RNA polymerase 1B n=1 Tax=Forsythia ovata TaxID=205694 RepID=A0ABD1SI80_9LAMI
MASNKGICYGCRKTGHSLEECKQKRRRPRCGKGYIKWMQVVKVLKTKGRLFSAAWDNDQPSGGLIEGPSSSIGLDKSVDKEKNEDLSSMFKMLANISEEKDVEISLNLTVRKGRGKGHELDS